MSAKRVSMADVNGAAKHVSRCFKGDLRIVAESRYGYIGLDLYDATGCVRTVATGMTKREARTYLEAMYEALYIVGRD